MLIAKYSELIDDVLPSLAADPSYPVVEYAIKRACIEFCAGSWLWKHLPDAIDVTAGESTYDIELLPATDITTVIAAELNNVTLEPKTIEWLNKEIPGWRTTLKTPKYFTQVDTEQIILAAVPDASITAGLTLTIALQPSQNSTGLPKWIFNQYLYALADGAIARLMLMPAKPWTDLINGQDRRSRFEAAIANARSNAVSALSRAAMRTTSQH